MDKLIDVPSFTHVVKLNDRKNIIISGIKKIINFDDKEFNLESIMGNIIIKGENLEIIKLDTIDGNVSIKGKINSFYQIRYSTIKKYNNNLLLNLTEAEYLKK